MISDSIVAFLFRIAFASLAMIFVANYTSSFIYGFITACLIIMILKFITYWYFRAKSYWIMNSLKKSTRVRVK